MSGFNAWLDSFEKSHGRPLRVLHIGNIANNAYNNAKIQRARGIAADVLCHDYYHIMACPEWEDADFSGAIADEMFPDWWAVKRNGFVRPRWFAQGPLDASVRYLLAHTISAPSAPCLWRALEVERWLLCRKSRAAAWLKHAIFAVTGRRIAYVSLPMNALLFRALSLAWSSLALLQPFPNDRRASRRKAQRFRRFSRAANLAADAQRHQSAMSRRLPALLRRAEALTPRGSSASQRVRPDDFEWLFLWWWHPYLALLYRRYDVIQAYATYTAMPFIAGLRSYTAYEHGTIRSIPFQASSEGRMCAMTYRSAAVVFVTNSDNLSAADKLELPPSRVVCLPHAFDSDKLDRFASARKPESVVQSGPVLFFSPARQHWVDNDPGWAKGNDRAIRAIHKVLDLGLQCRLRLVAWGKDLEATRSLVQALGLTEVVDWVPTMKKRELWQEYLAADAVLDQFIVPALGGVTFEAMMLGRRVISAIDKVETARFFGEPPPVYDCQSSDEIAEAMVDVCRDRQDLTGRGAANRAWMRKYHSADRIVKLQLSAYQTLLADQNATKGSIALSESSVHGAA
jgi:glycosyltransferase involved in cell wall biosynthesis